jgi:hypothetical protein
MQSSETEVPVREDSVATCPSEQPMLTKNQLIESIKATGGNISSLHPVKFVNNIRNIT